MEKRRMSVEDFENVTLLSNPIFTADKSGVIYEKTTVNQKGDDYETQIVYSAVDGTNTYVLTSAGRRNTNASLSPCGQFVLFTSNRELGTQLWILPLHGGEARRLTRFTYGVSHARWSSDGTYIVALVSADRDADIEVLDQDLTPKEAVEKQEKLAKEFADEPKHYDKIYYKSDGVGLSRKRYSQLVRIHVATGEVVQLTWGDSGIQTFAVRPDQAYIYFVANRRKRPDLNWWYSDLYRIPFHGGDAELLNDELLFDSISFSPDGKTFAAYANGDEFYEYKSATHRHLFLFSEDGTEVRRITENFPDQLGDTNLSDVHPSIRDNSPLWSADGKYIFALSTREGRSEVVRFRTTGAVGSDVVIGGSRDVYSIAFDGDNRFAVCYGTPVHPGKLVVVDLDEATFQTRELRQVTDRMEETKVPFYPQEQRIEHWNDAFFAEVHVEEPTPFWYTSEDGWRVQGFVLRPYGFTEGQKYPVILEIHGGPQLNYGYAMFHEMQWLAAQGFAVVYTNPRGGMSYGQTFVNAVRHHYGENDAADVLNGLQAALEKYSFLDETQVAVTGGSYGGFMTNWLVGHTDRFFAAVSQRSISNWFSFYGCSDIGPLFVESQLGGTIFTEPEKLWEKSPLAYANRVKTPLLLIHSEQDLRCPIEQAEQFYTAINREGGEVELFRIPNASHGLSRDGKPSLRRHRLEAIHKFISDRVPGTKLTDEGLTTTSNLV